MSDPDLTVMLQHGLGFRLTRGVFFSLVVTAALTDGISFGQDNLKNDTGFALLGGVEVTL